MKPKAALWTKVPIVLLKEQKLHNQFGAPMFIATRVTNEKCMSVSVLQASIST